MTASASNPSRQLVDGVDVDALGLAVRSCPGVDDLAAGSPGSVASYLPGRTVAGIRISDDHVTIQVRVRWGVPAVAVAGQVRHAVAHLVGMRRVDIVIADVVEPGATGSAAGLTPPRQLPAAPGEVGQWNQSISGPRVAPSSAPITPTPAVIPPGS